jgi:hypothetical protein
MSGRPAGKMFASEAAYRLMYVFEDAAIAFGVSATVENRQALRATRELLMEFIRRQETGEKGGDAPDESRRYTDRDMLAQSSPHPGT